MRGRPATAGGRDESRLENLSFAPSWRHRSAKKPSGSGRRFAVACQHRGPRTCCTTAPSACSVAPSAWTAPRKAPSCHPATPLASKVCVASNPTRCRPKRRRTAADAERRKPRSSYSCRREIRMNGKRLRRGLRRAYARANVPYAQGMYKICAPYAGLRPPYARFRHRCSQGLNFVSVVRNFSAQLG